MNSFTKIDSRTLIPIGAITIVVGATIWITTIYNLTQSNANKIETLIIKKDTHNNKLFDKIDNLNGRLSNIEGKIDLIIKQDDN